MRSIWKAGRAGLVLLTASLLSQSAARADVTLLLEEQIGPFWRMNPDHSAIYLSRVCAESPVTLRACAPGERGGVISRYHRIDGYDWVAIPLIPYLYAVERAVQVPASANPQQVAELREAYRKGHLEEVAADRTHSKDWPQLAGEAYDRTIYGFTIQTTPEQDAELLRKLNSGPNRNRFNIALQNCADFAAQLIDFYFPGAVHRSFRDLGITTPKGVARALVNYRKRHPELMFSVFEIPQVPGTAPRSEPIRGIPAMMSVAGAVCGRVPGDIPGSALPTLTCPIKEGHE
jgi:hypothetical protein